MTLQEELETAKRKLRVSEGKGGLSGRVEKIKARIAELEQQIAEEES